MPSIKRLYQYTTPDGLIGILATKTLWATSVFYLNDTRELIGGIEIAQNQLRGARDTASDEVQLERIDWLRQELRNIGKAFDSKPVYVSSLTTEDDQLSQWRAYCRGGGFAIGFPKDQLTEFIQSQHFDLLECVYATEDQQAVIRSVLDLTAMPWIQTARLPVKEDEDRFIVSGKLAWELLRNASRIKNDSFSEEREWRITSQPERPYHPEKLQFRSRNGMVVPYTAVQLPDDIDFWGKVKVVVGPTPYPNESKASVYDLFRRYHDHAIGIEISRTPFREW